MGKPSKISKGEIILFTMFIVNSLILLYIWFFEDWKGEPLFPHQTWNWENTVNWLSEFLKIFLHQFIVLWSIFLFPVFLIYGGLIIFLIWEYLASKKED